MYGKVGWSTQFWKIHYITQCRSIPQLPIAQVILRNAVRTHAESCKVQYDPRTKAASSLEVYEGA